VAGSSEHGIESSDPINNGKFPDQLKDYEILITDYAARTK
jgi:hypothetical protein